MKYYLAVDIGASSGRHIIGYMKDGIIHTDEVYRFKNELVKQDGHLIWDIDYILKEIIEGIKEAFSKYPIIESMSIDTWGVDYVMMNGDKEILPCYGYRDSRFEDDIENVHKLMSFDELYDITGCQFQKFNTVYQLYDDKIHGRLEKADDFLMMPEYFIYKLTGCKSREYTNATTTGLVNLDTGEYDKTIIKKLGYPKKLFKPLDQPGKLIGRLKDDIALYVGGNLDVVLCATHDTGSAVEGIIMDDDELYLSSGTWSLLGVKLKKGINDRSSLENNYTNEGGINYIRYQKNIMGMWVINCLHDELCPQKKIEEVVEMAEKSRYERYVDVNEPEFLAPISMKQVFDEKLGDTLNMEDYFRCAYNSLAMCYKRAIEEISVNTGRTYHKLYITGGGARNEFLNNLTESLSGIEVVALPIEASSIGNLKVQMER